MAHGIFKNLINWKIRTTDINELSGKERPIKNKLTLPKVIFFKIINAALSQIKRQDFISKNPNI